MSELLVLFLEEFLVPGIKEECFCTEIQSTNPSIETVKTIGNNMLEGTGGISLAHESFNFIHGMESDLIRGALLHDGNPGAIFLLEVVEVSAGKAGFVNGQLGEVGGDEQDQVSGGVKHELSTVTGLDKGILTFLIPGNDFLLGSSVFSKSGDKGNSGKAEGQQQGNNLLQHINDLL